MREWVITEGLKDLFASPEKSPAAREWLLGIEDLKLQDQSKLMIPDDPARAWELALAIPDTKRREEAIKAVHREWMKVDPKTADAAWKEMRKGK